MTIKSDGKKEYFFVRNSNICVRCGNCTLHGGWIMQDMFFGVDENFYNKNLKTINKVLEKCFLEALTLQRDNYG